MPALPYLVVFLAGLAAPVQSGANSAMNKVLQAPFAVGFLSAVGSLVLLLLVAILFRQLGFGGKAAKAPWWSWLVGLFGAVLLMSQPVVSGKIGAGTYIGLLVTASTIASIGIDHFGWLHFPQRTATRWRIGGGALMILGVALVAIG